MEGKVMTLHKITNKIKQENGAACGLNTSSGYLPKCNACPECGCEDFGFEDEIGEGNRVCANCTQEWWTNIDYAETANEELSRLFNKIQETYFMGRKLK